MPKQAISESSSSPPPITAIFLLAQDPHRLFPPHKSDHQVLSLDKKPSPVKRWTDGMRGLGLTYFKAQRGEAILWSCKASSATTLPGTRNTSSPCDGSSRDLVKPGHPSHELWGVCVSPAGSSIPSSPELCAFSLQVHIYFTPVRASILCPDHPHLETLQ